MKKKLLLLFICLLLLVPLVNAAFVFDSSGDSFVSDGTDSNHRGYNIQANVDAYLINFTYDVAIQAGTYNCTLWYSQNFTAIESVLSSTGICDFSALKPRLNELEEYCISTYKSSGIKSRDNSPAFPNGTNINYINGSTCDSALSYSTIGWSIFSVTTEDVVISENFLSPFIISPVNGSVFDYSNNSITVSYNGSASPELANCTLYVDSVSNQTHTNINLSTNDNFNLTIDSSGAYFDLNISCNNSEIINSTVVNIWVNSSRFSTIDLLFRNATSSIYTDTFDESENFVSLINWSWDNGSSVDGGLCNLTIQDGLDEEVAGDDNFTVCNSGCDFLTYTDSFESFETTNAVEDLIHFRGCHEQTNIGDVTLAYNCTGASYTETISASQLPACGDGLALIIVNTTACIGQSTVTINVTGDVPNSQRKMIVELALDREFSLKINNASYNASILLWGVNHSHEFYEQGSKNIYANCSYPGNNDVDNSVSENITIINIPPQIFFNSVNNSVGTTNLSNNVVVEYADGVWSWMVSLIDDDLDYVNYSWWNSTHQLYSVAGNALTTIPDTPTDTFLLFDSFFTFNITVNDTFGNTTTAGLIFRLNDTVGPIIDVHRPIEDTVYNIINNINFSATCTDEAVYRFNLTVVANDTTVVSSNETLNIGASSYFFQTLLNASILGVGNHYGNYTCADSHTLEELKYLQDPVIKGNKFDFGSFNISLLEDHITSLDFVRQKDRIAFIIDHSQSVNVINYRIEAESFIEVDNSDYCGHLVFMAGGVEYWFTADEGAYCNIEIRNGYVDVSASLPSPMSEIIGKSVGEINIVTVQYNFSVGTFDPPTVVLDTPANNTFWNERYVNVTFNVSDTGNHEVNSTLQFSTDLADWSFCNNLSFINATATPQVVAINTTCSFSSNQLYYWRVNSSDGTNNTISDVWQFTYNWTGPAAPTPWNEQTDMREFVSISQAISYIWLVIFWVILFICMLVFRGPHGKPIGILAMMQIMTGFAAGFQLMEFYYIVGFTIIIGAIGSGALMIFSEK